MENINPGLTGKHQLSIAPQPIYFTNRFTQVSGVYLELTKKHEEGQELVFVFKPEVLWRFIT